MPPEIFSPASYAEKPKAFQAFSHAILRSAGLHVVTPVMNIYLLSLFLLLTVVWLMDVALPAASAARLPKVGDTHPSEMKAAVAKLK